MNLTQEENMTLDLLIDSISNELNEALSDGDYEAAEVLQARFALLKKMGAQDEHKLCPHCGTLEIELERTCHNSSCSNYAQAESVYRGWEKDA